MRYPLYLDFGPLRFELRHSMGEPDVASLLIVRWDGRYVGHAYAGQA